MFFVCSQVRSSVRKENEQSEDRAEHVVLCCLASGSDRTNEAKMLVRSFVLIGDIDGTPSF